MTDDNTENTDNTERDQKIKEEYDTLISRGTHDTASATNAIAIQYKLSADEVHAIVGPSTEQTKLEEDGDANASQKRQDRQDD